MPLTSNNESKDKSPVLSEIKCFERIQVGDVFLLKFKCPYCKVENLEGHPLKSCPSCKKSYENAVVDLGNVRRLLFGTRRVKRISKRIVQELISLYGRKCTYCFEDLEHKDFHIDHIVPVSVGGTNNITNLTIACPTCNLRAGAKAFPSLAVKQQYLQNKRKSYVEAA